MIMNNTEQYEKQLDRSLSSILARVVLVLVLFHFKSHAENGVYVVVKKVPGRVAWRGDVT